MSDDSERSETSIYFEGLFSRAVDGDRESEGALFHSYEPVIRATVRTLYGGQPQSDQEDLIQEVFLSALGSFKGHNWTSREGFARWLRCIVDRRRTDLLRKENAQKRDVKRVVRGFELDRYRADTMGIETKFQKREEQSELYRLIEEAGLPYNQEQALLLSLCHHSQAEIAEALELASAEAARKLVSRAKKALNELKRRQDEQNPT